MCSHCWEGAAIADCCMNSLGVVKTWLLLLFRAPPPPIQSNYLTQVYLVESVSLLGLITETWVRGYLKVQCSLPNCPVNENSHSSMDKDFPSDTQTESSPATNLELPPGTRCSWDRLCTACRKAQEAVTDISGESLTTLHTFSSDGISTGPDIKSK